MHCPNCGKELNLNQKFCGGCGTDVSSLWQQAVPVAAEPVVEAANDAADATAAPDAAEPVPVPENAADEFVTEAVEPVATTEPEPVAAEPVSNDFGVDDPDIPDLSNLDEMLKLAGL